MGNILRKNKKSPSKGDKVTNSQSDQVPPSANKENIGNSSSAPAKNDKTVDTKPKESNNLSTKPSESTPGPGDATLTNTTSPPQTKDDDLQQPQNKNEKEVDKPENADSQPGGVESKNIDSSQLSQPSTPAVSEAAPSTQTNEDDDGQNRQRKKNEESGKSVPVDDLAANPPPASQSPSYVESPKDANEASVKSPTIAHKKALNDINDPPTVKGVPSQHLQPPGSSSSVKSSPQAPDDLNNPSITTPKDTPSQPSQDLENGSGAKPSTSVAHTQAPDDFKDPPIITPKDTPSQRSQLLENGSSVKPSTSVVHTQAPDDFNDPPINIPQDTQSQDSRLVENSNSVKPPTSVAHTQAPDDYDDPPKITTGNASGEKKPVFNPRIMPAWAEEFLATRCGKSNAALLAYKPPPLPNNKYSNNEPAKPNPSEQKSATKSKAPLSKPAINKEDEEPGCCKSCCFCSCFCRWDSWLIWLIILALVLMLIFLIAWKECGLKVLVLEDLELENIFGVSHSMQLFLSTLGYFAYFMLVCCCYCCCKTACLPNDPKGLCSCKEIKLVIHMIYGIVLGIFLYRAIKPWWDDKSQYDRHKRAKTIHHIFECLELCFWYTVVIFSLGLIAFIIYSLERRKIRKRIAPARNQVENNPPWTARNQPHYQRQEFATAGKKHVSNDGQLPIYYTNNTPTSTLQSVYVDCTRPIYPSCPPVHRIQSRLGCCCEDSPYSFRRNDFNFTY